MPNRMMRDTARTSKTLDLLSDGAERLFWRLLLAADDFGRFYGDPDLVLAACFPRRVGRLDTQQAADWLNELVSSGIIRLYSVDERQYVEFVTWAKHQKIRAKFSKYPAPTGSVSNCLQLQAARDNSPQNVSEDEKREARTTDENNETRTTSARHLPARGKLSQVLEGPNTNPNKGGSS